MADWASHFKVVGHGLYTDFETSVNLLNAFGSNQWTLIVPRGIHTVNDDLIVNDNIRLIIHNGAEIIIANTKTLYLYGIIEAGHYKIFSGDGTVDVSKSLIKEVSLCWWDITKCAYAGPYIGDISSALSAASAAVSSGQTITLPAGVFRLTTPTTILKSWGQFRLQGVSSYDTHIYIDVGLGNDGLIIGEANGNALLHSTCLDIRHLSFTGNIAGACKNGLRIMEVMEVRFDDVNFHLYTAEYGLSIEGCCFVKGNVEITGTGNYTDSGYYTERCINGINICSTNTYQSNVIDLYAQIHNLKPGNTGTGINLDGSTIAYAAVKISGSIENTLGYYIKADSLSNIDLSNLYMENTSLGVLLQNVTCGRLTNILHNNNSPLQLSNCGNIFIDTYNTTGDIIIDQDCSSITVGNISTKVGGLKNYAADTKFVGNVTAFNAFPEAMALPGHDAKNLFPNVSLERWETDRPVGWDKPATVTWVKCGTGLVDTTNHRTPYCVRADVSGGDATSSFSFDANQLLQMKGQLVNFTVWIKIDSTGNPTFTYYPSIVLGFHAPDWNDATEFEIGDAVHITNGGLEYLFYALNNGTSGGSEPTWTFTIGDRITDNTITWVCRYALQNSGNAMELTSSDIGHWKQLRVDALCPNNVTGILYSAFYLRTTSTGGDASYYISEPSLMVGRGNPRGVVLGLGESQKFVQIGAIKLWETTPSAGVWVAVGDIDLSTGQRCTVAGAQGSGATWSNFP